MYLAPLDVLTQVFLQRTSGQVKLEAHSWGKISEEQVSPVWTSSDSQNVEYDLQYKIWILYLNLGSDKPDAVYH